MMYNLLDEPWIPVLMADGTVARKGIKDTLLQADHIRGIAASNPMDRFAVLRFLLALLYWCKGNPSEQANSAYPARITLDCLRKLDKNKDCFHLLGKGKRFYQNQSTQRPKAITELLQEIPTGNNFWHFRHATDCKDRLCLSCCALGLLRLPLFSVSGLPDLKSGINGTPPIYIMPLGITLLETLCLNWTERKDLGTPSWAPPESSPIPESPPLLLGLTTLARKVWLHDPETTGVCTACGRPGTAAVPLIRTCEFDTAGRLENPNWNDPHVIYYHDSKQKRKPRKTSDPARPGAFKMDRPLWDLLPDCIEKIVSERAVSTLFIIGFATDKAKNCDVWERTLIVPVAETALIDQWNKSGNQLKKTLQSPQLLRSKIAASAALATIRPQIEHRVSERVGQILTEGSAAWEEAANEYQPMMNRIAQSFSPGFTTQDIQRRRDIKDLKPNMSPKAETRARKSHNKLEK